MHSLRFALAAGVVAGLAAAQVSHVLPDGLAAAEGNHLNNIPWGTGGGVRVQFLYDSTHFTNAASPINYPIIIQRLRWRANGSATATWTGGSYSQAIIDLSTAATDYLVPSPTFADNHGQDRTTVRNGAVTMIPEPTGFGIPGPWYVDVPLTTGFFYDPTGGGDLLIDVDIPTGTWTGGTRSIMDWHQGGGAMASRVSASLTYGSPTGGVSVGEAAVVDVEFVPASGVFPRFTATPRAGNSPLMVQFTDNSWTSDPGGILAWQWDFDNDGVVDSSVQSPAYTYNTCGSYTVRLTVFDANGPRSLLRPAAVVVDAIAVDFTGTPLAGLAPVFVQFTDASTGPVTSWAWDFDNDGVVDSNLRNPVWPYGQAGRYSVRLTVGNGCFSDSLTRTDYVVVIDPTNLPPPPDILQYQFNEVRGQQVANTASGPALPPRGLVNTAGWQGDPGRPDYRGNEAGAGMLGSTSGVGATNLVNAQGGMSITGSMTVMWWQRQIGTPPSTSYACGSSSGAGPRMYTGGGTAGQTMLYRGSSIGDALGTSSIQNSIGVWRHVALVVDDAAGTASWHFDGIADPPRLFTASTHVANWTEFHVGYGSSATGTGSALPMWFEMDDFRIYSRALSAGDIQAVIALGENPSAGAWGSFCDGPGGTPEIGANGLPSLGNLGFVVTLANAEDGRLTAMVLGLAPLTRGPFDLSAILGPGCQLEMDWIAANFHVTSGGGAAQAVPVPNTGPVRGLHVYGQWLLAGTVGAASRAIDISVR